MNLGTGRLLVIVALVVVGVLVLSQGFDEAGTVAQPTGSASPSVSGSGSPEPTGSASPDGETGAEAPEPNTTGVPFMALNGTSTTGAGAAAQELLEAEGYDSVLDAADSPVQNVSQTTVYFQGGADAAQNKADAQYVSDTFFDGEAQVKKLAPAFAETVPESATLVVVVGADFAETLVAGA
ncbi:MAG TPA: LytR C-terminal domain-containing protein [Actinomycetota bacterium]